MMIAWERFLESKNENALFQDPFAEALAGTKGEKLSEGFGNNCTMFEFEGWPEFHKTWVAVRTRFIDDRIAQHAASGKFAQIVNLGAGMDTRAHRMECYKAFATGSIEVDMAVINDNKKKVFGELLGAPAPHCPQTYIDLDFLDEEKTLATELGSPFDANAPTVFVSEGLIMYLGGIGKMKLLKDVSAVAAPGSVFVLQFMSAEGTQAAKDNPAALDAALSQTQVTQALTEHGWEGLEFYKFGDEGLNFGRFPNDKFEPRGTFAFCVCTKAK